MSPNRGKCARSGRHARPGTAARPPLGPLLAALLALAPTAKAFPGQEAAGNRPDYRIEARVDGEPTEPKQLSGSLELRWQNGSGDAVGDLWFHLYLNAFSNNRSTHLLEARGKLKGHEVRDGWGWSRVTAIEVARAGEGGFEDVFPTFRYRRPDDSNPDDRTVFSVDLPWRVEPGQSVVVRLEWESQLPRVRRRTGSKDDFVMAGQWFPKIGVYETGRGWNCHQFHSNSEFFADYGTYDVTLNLPGRYSDRKIGTSGFAEYSSAGDRAIVRALAPSDADRRRTDATGRSPLVHDFAWTADPRYVHERYHFDPQRWIERFPEEVERARRAFGPDEDLGMRGVDLNVLIQPERAGQADRHSEATEAALFFYGLWFGEYPYQNLTIVDPRWGAESATGMEYPTLFTGRTSLFTTEDMHRPESTVIHEAGHQFFYGLVGSNEFEAAWLDEGINSWADAEVLWKVYGPKRSTTSYGSIPIDGVPVARVESDEALGRALSGQRIPMPWIVPDLAPLRSSAILDWWRDQPQLCFVPEWSDPRWADRNGYLASPDTDAVDTYAWEYADRRSYSTNTYRRTSVAVRSLKAVVGPDSFMRGMRHYAKQWRYRHPYPADFYASFQEGARAEVDWYFEDLFETTETLDWSVEVDQRRRPDRLGYFQGEGGQFIEGPETKRDGEEDERPWQVEILLWRRGGLRLPLPYRLTWEDGTTEDLVWSREEQEGRNWTRVERVVEKKLVSVVLDPARFEEDGDAYYLDQDFSDNQWFAETDEVAPLRWGERALATFQHYFHWVSGIGG